MINFDEITNKILNSIPKPNRKVARQQFNKLNNNFSDYVGVLRNNQKASSFRLWSNSLIA